MQPPQEAPSFLKYTLAGPVLGSQPMSPCMSGSPSGSLSQQRPKTTIDKSKFWHGSDKETEAPCLEDD